MSEREGERRRERERGGISERNRKGERKTEEKERE